jgi:hypothetical protein
MAIDPTRFWRRFAVNGLLLLFLLLGVLFIAVPHIPIVAQSWSTGFGDFVVKIGQAFFIAGILGLAVDGALKKDLVRDAVAASLGHLLPEQLKTELRWLYDQRILVEQVYHVRLEHLPEERAVRFYGSYNRRFRNVSGEAAELHVGGGCDEWFHPKGEATLEACEYRRISADKPGRTVRLQPKMGALGIGYGPEKLELAVDEVVEVFISYTMWMPDNAYEFLTHRYLIDRPLVTVDVPSTLVAFVAFSHRDNYSEEDYTSGHISSRLERVLLPHQDIRICWHRRTDVDSRSRNLRQAQQ